MQMPLILHLGKLLICKVYEFRSFSLFCPWLKIQCSGSELILNMEPYSEKVFANKDQNPT